MKYIRLVSIALFLGAVSAYGAEAQSTPATPEKPACCTRAELKGKTCTNPCCVEAAKAGKVCEKCLKKGHDKKKHGAKAHSKPAASTTSDEPAANTPATAPAAQ